MVGPFLPPVKKTIDFLPIGDLIFIVVIPGSLKPERSPEDRNENSQQ
jgi:hypothetical protein